MILRGKIIDWDGRSLSVKADFCDAYVMQKLKPDECEIRLIDGRSINADQRKKAYALMRDISAYTGHMPDAVKEIMKYDFISKTGLPIFSLSDVDMSTARAFIDHMVEFCLEWGIPCKDSLLEQAEDIGRYLYLCMYHRKCCVCGKKAEIHHVDAIGMGGNRKELCHIGYRAMALCRKHHNEAHNNPNFSKLYHVYGIKIDEVLARHLKLGKIKEGANAQQDNSHWPLNG